MKPLFRKISKQSDSSFSVQHYKEKHFYKNWHFHPELELVWFQNGTGTRLIGDNVEPISKGELILIGTNLPHLMRSDDDCQLSESLVIHITEDFAGQHFLHLPEMKMVKDLFYRCKLGLKFDGIAKENTIVLMQELEKSTGIQRFITLFEILKNLSECKESRVLSKISSNSFNNTIDTTRINKIYAYVLENFSDNLTIDTIAKVSNLSPTSFCRYFKKCCNKTFFDFLKEVRIGFACKQLIETEKPVSQICMESGYNNISNFNAYFKKVTNMSPTDYKKNFVKLV